jgi:transcriptional regulator with XRE-family HTH domain
MATDDISALVITTSVVSARRRQPPDWAIVDFRGFPHLIHLRHMRRRLLDNQVQRSDVDSLLAIAAKANCSRSTVSRLFAGRQVSVRVLLTVLDELGLEFSEVCFPLEGELLNRLVREGVIVVNGTTHTVNPGQLPAVVERLQVLQALPEAQALQGAVEEMEA